MKILAVDTSSKNCSVAILEVNNDKFNVLICENSENALYKALNLMMINKDKFNYYKDMVKERKEIFDIKVALKNIEELFKE